MVGTLENGKKGEEIAVDYLRKKGFKILHRNWRFRHKEVDIIAQDGNKLVIIEVKLRSTDYFGGAGESVPLKKQRFLIEATNAYIDTLDYTPNVRFDIIFIVSSPQGDKIEHIDDAYIA